MSVRATDSLIGDLVKVTDLPNSPVMVVKSVNAGEKLVTTAWFSTQQEGQEGTFPASALDRAEAKAKVVKTAKSVSKSTKRKK